MSNTQEVIEKNRGIRLDIGCGGNKNPGYVGLDARAMDGVDIVWDVTMFPWPLPDESVLLATASHLLEHIPPFQPDPKLLGLIKLLTDAGLITAELVEEYIGEYDSTPIFMRFMNEVWRIMKPGGQFMIVVPYGRSDGFLQDPSHCNAMNETRWAYFDPFENRANGMLWRIYRPLPWKLEFLSWTPEANMEVILSKRTLEEIAHV